MAEKTHDEILASGTLQEIIAQQTKNVKRADEVFKKSDATAEELEEAVRLGAETDALQVKRVQLETIESAKAQNTKRVEELKAPAGNVKFHGGDGGDDKPVVEFRGVGELKHIVGATRQEAELKAFRFGQFILGGVLKSAPAIDYCAKNGISLKAVNESINEQGAVLVPEEFDRTIIRLIELYGVFRANTRVVPMASDVRTQPRRTGGVTAYWVGEGKQITASQPSWDDIKLVAKKLAALIVHSSEISEDAIINLADDLAFEIGYAFSQSEDSAGFLGDGTSTYGLITGVSNALLNLSATRANIAGLVVGSDNIWSGLALTDFEAVQGRLPVYADTPNTKWYAHKAFYHSTMKRLELAAGGVTAAEIAAGGGRTQTFLGYPVQFTQIMPRVEANDQVCALFGDLSLASTMGDRRRITLFNDPYSLSNYDQTQIRGTERVDIVVHDVGNQSGTASLRVAGPMVGLLTAAS